MLRYFLIKPVHLVFMADLKRAAADYAELAAEVIPEGWLVVALKESDSLEELREGLAAEIETRCEVSPFAPERVTPEMVAYAGWKRCTLGYFFRTPERRPTLPTIRLSGIPKLNKRVW